MSIETNYYGQKGEKYTINNYDNHLSFVNGEWYVNGEKMSLDEMVKKGIAKKEGAASKAENNIEITVQGNVERINGDKVNVIVEESCGRIDTTYGNVKVWGNVEGDVESKFGNIECGNVSGDVNSKFGNISYKNDEE